MKKVLWFSRHELTPEQKSGLAHVLHVPEDDLSVRVLDRTISRASEIAGALEGEDLVAAVLPVRLLSELMPLLPASVTVAVPRNRRVRDDQGEYRYVYDGWDVIKQCIYETEIVM